MNQTLLIVVGCTVFAMTVVAVLIYFYALVAGLAAASNAPAADVRPMRVSDDGI